MGWGSTPLLVQSQWLFAVPARPHLYDGEIQIMLAVGNFTDAMHLDWLPRLDPTFSIYLFF